MKQLQTFGGLKLIASLSVTLLLSSCRLVNFFHPKPFPGSISSRTTIISSARDGMRLFAWGIEDCETYRKGGNSLLKWDDNNM